MGLAIRGCRDFEAEWAAVIDHRSPEPLASAGKPPELPWISAFVQGSRASVKVAAGETGPDDVAWSNLSARIADARWTEMVIHRPR